MKLLFKLTALAACIALLLSLASCTDFGVGENEDDFKKYLSSVHVLSEGGIKQYSIEVFNRDINIEDTDIPIVVPYDEYCYIGFQVSAGYNVSISEFAFFAKTISGEGVLELEFYVVDKMPTSIKNDSGEDVKLPSLDETETALPEESVPVESGSETEDATEDQTEIYEEELFDPSKRFHVSTFPIGEEWNSVLLQFDGEKTVKSGQYIVVRINNNCYTSSGEDEEATPSVSFTFNYLLFHFTDAHKE